MTAGGRRDWWLLLALAVAGCEASPAPPVTSSGGTPQCLLPAREPSRPACMVAEQEAGSVATHAEDAARCCHAPSCPAPERGCGCRGDSSACEG